MNATKREAIFRIFEKNNPSPKTELQFRNHFELLIAVMLSAQATDISVNKATPLLFEKAPTPQKMIFLGEEGIQKYIKTLNLYRSKAKHVYATCELLLKNYNGNIPNTRKELESLPGVGVKTAGVVLNVAFQVSTIPVDTHVFRVSNRIPLVKTKNEKETEEALLKKIPKWAIFNAHHWLILHGRYICKARKPLCQKCIIYEYCEYKQKI